MQFLSHEKSLTLTEKEINLNKKFNKLKELEKNMDKKAEKCEYDEL